MYAFITAITIITILLAIYKLKILLRQCIENEKAEYLMTTYHENNEKLLSIISFILFLGIISIYMYKSYGNLQVESNFILVDIMFLSFLTLYFIISIILNYKVKIAIKDAGLSVRGKEITWNMLSFIRRKGDKMIICYDLGVNYNPGRYKFVVANYDEKIYKLITDNIKE